MNSHGWLQILLFFAVVLLLVKPLGSYMARVYEGKRIIGLSRVFGPTERVIYRLGGVDPESEMGWKRYAANVYWLLLRCVMLKHNLRVSTKPWHAMGRYNSAKFLSILSPSVWLFSGWNCVAKMLSRQTIAQNGPP